MGITRSKFHKKRSTGGRRKIWRKKRKYEMGRQPANTKLTPGNTDVRPLRVRGGNMKFRALRLDHGNFAWASEVVTRKTRIIDVVYNASNNELVSKCQGVVELEGACCGIHAAKMAHVGPHTWSRPHLVWLA